MSNSGLKCLESNCQDKEDTMKLKLKYLMLTIFAALAILWLAHQFYFSNNRYLQTDNRKSLKEKRSGTASSEILYNSGLDFFKSKKYNKAIKEFKLVIQSNPHHWQAYQRICDAFIITRELPRAKKYFEELILKFSENPYPYYCLGLILEKEQEITTAIASYKKAVHLLPQFADVYAHLSSAFNMTDKSNEAIRFLTGLLMSNPNNPYVYYGLANTYRKEARQDSALANLDKAIRLKNDLVESYRLKALVFLDSGDFIKAIEVAQLSLQIAEGNKDLDKKSMILADMAGAYWRLGENQKALDCLTDALRISQQVANITTVATVLSTKGLISRQIGEMQEALRYFNQALEINKEMLDNNGEGIDLSNIGDVYSQLGDCEQALSLYHQALPLLEKAGNKKQTAITLGAIGTAYSLQGNYPLALEYGKRAIGLHKEIGNKSSESNDLGNLAASYYEQGDYTKALECLSQALSIADEIDEKYKQQIWLGNIGSIYTILGNYVRALYFLEKAKNIAQQINDKNSEGYWIGNIGIINLEQSDTTNGLENLKKALGFFIETADKRAESSAYANIANIYTYQGNYQQALEYFNRALTIAQEIGNRFGEGETYVNIGALYLKTKDFPKAIEAFNNALNIGNQINALPIIWAAQFGLGQVYHEQGNFTEALNYYKKAIEIIESVRGQLILEEHRSSFFANKITVYENLIDLLYQFHQQAPEKQYDREAFVYAERAKARALLDLLSEAKTNIKNVDPELLKQQKDIFQNISRIQTRLYNEELSDSEMQRLKSDLPVEEEKLEDLRFEIKRSNPAYAALNYPQSVSIAELQKKILGKNEALIEYLIGEENSFAWAITRDSVRFVKLPEFNNIKNEVEKYLDAINRPPEPEVSIVSSGQSLYQMLIRPIIHILPNKPDIIIVPDGFLHYLPFEAVILSIENNQLHFLIESYTIAYAPSASVLGFMRANLSKTGAEIDHQLLAFGDPVFGKKNIKPPEAQIIAKTEINERGFYEDQGFYFSRLPYAALEVKKIGEIFANEQTRIYVEDEATEEKLKNEITNPYRMLHFATHGLLDEKRPGRSCIVFALDDDPAEDGFLQMNEIFNLRLNADLVVLSACKSGGGKLVRGEGLVGLTRAFLYAGAKTMVVSLWSVDDQSTAQFMEKFYTSLVTGSHKNKALRQAKLSFIKGSMPALRHPYYWAPFVLIGENR